ncbi:MAG TPA: ABC transporter ATP-binding protein [Candidatus Omnitrophica bacterium]|nr:ABC transporter ATP-binding protein [Candidatus Omnitrophota bacterium]
MTIIEVENIIKEFSLPLTLKDLAKLNFRPLRFKALDKVSLSVGEGEIFALLGPNSAGKTTLLKIICKLLLPDKGRIKVRGNIGYLSGEIPGFYPQLTAQQNLEFFGTIYNLSSSQIKKRMRKYSQVLGIDNLNKPFWHYSTGLKHKLSLLRTLMIDTNIIIMDEPTKNLDPLASKNLRRLIYKISKEFNKTILFATHFLEEAEEISERLAIIDKGKIVLIKEAKEVKGCLEELFKNTLKRNA